MTDDLDAALEQKGNRFENTDEDDDEFRQLIRDELEKIDEGEEQPTMSIWDPDTAAFIRALLEDDDRREDVGTTLQNMLGRKEDADDIDRSELIKMFLRVGMQTAAEDSVEELVEVKRESAAQL